MKDSISSISRQNIASLLKNRRNEVQPEDVGIPRGSRRRIPGLRREEVSTLAGVSTEWYTWLEQGRNIRASAKTLRNISHVLRMDPNEETLLLSLSGHSSHVTSDLQHSKRVSPQIQALLDQQYPFPAYVSGPRWDILAWNEAIHVIFPEIESPRNRERNSLLNMFLSKAYRDMLVDWEYHARGIVSKLHSMSAEWQEDPWFVEMVNTLKNESPKFEQIWEERKIMGYKDGFKSYNHPEAGRLNLEYMTLKTMDEHYNHLRITLFIPHDTQTELNLRKFLGEE